MSAPHKLSLAVQYATGTEHLPTRPQFRRWIKAALQHDAQIALRIVDETEGRALNKNFRGKDYATNVLTFVYDDAEPTPQPPLSGGLTGSSPDCGSVAAQQRGTHRRTSCGCKGRLGGVAVPPLSGDIVICAPVVEKEASAQHKELHAHYAHLTIHAALHLQGYDHENDRDAAAMEACETALLAKLGYADPYQAVT